MSEEAQRILDAFYAEQNACCPHDSLHIEDEDNVFCNDCYERI